MRVIAGIAGGRKLQAPKGHTTRPTPDRVKEALFSILGQHVVGARVLDAFAGSGALGIEALSRGAAHGVFLDNAPQATVALKHNLAALWGPQGPYEVVAQDSLVSLRRLGEAAVTFDIIFLDPPYASRLVPKALEQVVRYGLLSPRGILVAEHEGKSESFSAPSPLQCTDVRRYGDVALSFYQHGDQPPSHQGAQHR